MVLWAMGSSVLISKFSETLVLVAAGVLWNEADGSDAQSKAEALVVCVHGAG